MLWQLAALVLGLTSLAECRGLKGTELSTQVKTPQTAEEAEQFTKELEHVLRTDPESAATIACFLCRQLMAASGQRVGLSQQQLQDSLHEKCHRLPEDLAAHCSNFVETFLQEIYFSLNYDFSAKNVCVALNICDKDMEITVESKAEKKERERLEREKREKEEREAEEKRIKEERDRLEIERRLKLEKETRERRERQERAERERQELLEKERQLKERLERERVERERKERVEKERKERAERERQERMERERQEKKRLEKEREEKERLEREKKEEEEKAKKRRKGVEEMLSKDEKKLNCMFCDRMLDNAKSYAEMAKADIESFAATACAKWPRQHFSNQCHRMAEEKINRLNKFVDEQVVEALWCSELNQCDTNP